MIRICIVVGLLAWGGAAGADADGNRGPFDLVDHTGRAVTDAAYRGSYVLLFFGYASCPDICPTDLAVMADAVELLGPTARGCSRCSFPSTRSATRRSVSPPMSRTSIRA